MIRLEEDTPARIAFKEYLSEDKKPAHRPTLTWYRTVYEDIKNHSGLNINFRDINKATREILILCGDRSIWKDLIKRIMLHRATNMQ